MANAYVRRNKIFEILKQEGAVQVEKLSETLGVSSVTIRTDLNFLEKSDALVVRCHGGAVYEAERNAVDIPLADKQGINTDIKVKLAKAAAALIQDGDAVLLDNGSTIDLISRELDDKRDLAVMTNSLESAYRLKDAKNVKLMIVGGNVRPNSHSAYGSFAESYILEHRFDKLFLGVDGFDLDIGITTPNTDEASINRAMVKVSKEVIVVTDSSKFNKRSYCSICDISRISKLVTDNNISTEIRVKIEAQGIEVITV